MNISNYPFNPSNIPLKEEENAGEKKHKVGIENKRLFPIVGATSVIQSNACQGEEKKILRHTDSRKLLGKLKRRNTVGYKVGLSLEENISTMSSGEEAENETKGQIPPEISLSLPKSFFSSGQKHSSLKESFDSLTLSTPRTAQQLASLNAADIKFWHESYRERIPENEALNITHSQISDKESFNLGKLLRLIETLLKEEEIEKIERNINNIIELISEFKDSTSWHLFYETILQYLEKDPSRKSVPLLTEIMTESLKKISNQQLFIQKSIIENISLEGVRLFVLINVRFKDEYLQEFIHIFLKNYYKDPVLGKHILFCHPWYFTTKDLIKGFYIKALENSEFAPILLEATQHLMNSPFYPIPIDVLTELYDFIPKHSNQKNDLTKKFQQAIWLRLRVPISSILSRRKSTSQTDLRSFNEEIYLRINNENKKMSGKKMAENIAALSRDFKKIEAKYLLQLFPGEIAAYKSFSPTSQEAPHVIDYINYSNCLSYFFAKMIIHSPNIKIAARWCEFTIKLMMSCWDLGNYSTPFSLQSALNIVSVDRLKDVWLEVDPKDLANKEKVKEILDPQLKVFRKWIEEQDNKKKKITFENCPIPILNTYLSCFALINEGNEDYESNNYNHLNENKILLYAKELASLQKYQNQILSFKSELEEYQFDFFFHLKAEAENVKENFSKKIFSKEIKKNFTPYDVAFDKLYQDSKNLYESKKSLKSSTSVINLFLSNPIGPNE